MLMEKNYKVYHGNIQKEPGTIFVFGSNPEGRHGAGSAAFAARNFGAKYGEGVGLTGDAYALPTTELRPWLQSGPAGHRQSISLDTIQFYISELYQCCREHPDKIFKVAYRNQPDEVTLCGYSGRELMGAFREAAENHNGYPDNIAFSEEWANSGLL